MKITNHKLADVPFKKSPNTGGLFGEDMPDTIVIHYTAGASTESSVNTLCSPATGASAHLVVARDGGITQLVPFNTIAWHAGQSSYKGRNGFNKYSIGIEIDNPGRLTKSGEKYYAWFGKEYPREVVFEGVHRNETTLSFWHRYTEEQISTVFRICEILTEHYGIKLILGHEEISPGRKSDPGPAFPLDKVRERVLDKDRRADRPAIGLPVTQKRGIVTAGKLNIRSSPLMSAVTVASPLTRGTILNIEEERGGWYKVKVEIEGWVKKDFVKT